MLQNAYCLEVAPDWRKKDRDIVNFAVLNAPKEIDRADPVLQNDKAFILSIINNMDSAKKGQLYVQLPDAL